MDNNNNSNSKDDRSKDDRSNQNIISQSNKYFAHLTNYKNYYLLSLTLVVTLIPLLMSIFSNNLLIQGEESYFHLIEAGGYSTTTIFPYFLKMLNYQYINNIFIILPLLLAFGSIFFLLKTADQLKLPPEFTLFFLVMLIITPVFIDTFSTLSLYGFYTLLISLGFYLISNENKRVKWMACIPFILATFTDLASVIFLAALLTIYSIIFKENRRISIFLIALIITLGIFNFFAMSMNFFINHFHSQHLTIDLISDLGGKSGLGMFTLLLSLIGLSTTWKKKNFYFAYFFTIPLIIFYWYNTQTVFHLTILIIFFSTVGFINLFNRKWTLESLKRFSLLLIVLGILFSTLTYLGRSTDNQFSIEEAETLGWIKDQISEEGKIYSFPDKSNFINYFSYKDTFHNLDSDENKKKAANIILNSTYADQTLPLLEDNNINIIYVTEDMKLTLPSDQGLLFLLKNERFKLVHSQGDTEVWVFSKLNN